LRDEGDGQRSGAGVEGSRDAQPQPPGRVRLRFELGTGLFEARLERPDRLDDRAFETAAVRGACGVLRAPVLQAVIEYIERPASAGAPAPRVEKCPRTEARSPAAVSVRRAGISAEAKGASSSSRSKSGTGAAGASAGGMMPHRGGKRAAGLSMRQT
jgi:hypothetical protein